jgi:hypothetical protein
MANSKTAAHESTPTDLRRSASVHFLTSSTRPGQRSVPSTQMLPTSRNEPVALLADIDGVPTLIRFLATDLPGEMQFNDGYFVSKDTDIHSLLSNALEKVAETVLRVGSLELDLIGRTAKRGDRAPETNLVDVHMGRLRRKVDGPDDVPMIRNVRGAGFVLSATPTYKVLIDEDSTRV